MKKLTLLLSLLLLVVFSASAQQYTRIGVVDMARIYDQYYKESKAVRE